MSDDLCVARNLEATSRAFAILPLMYESGRIWPAVNDLQARKVLASLFNLPITRSDADAYAKYMKHFAPWERKYRGLLRDALRASDIGERLLAGPSAFAVYFASLDRPLLPSLQPPKALDALTLKLTEHLHWFLRISKPKTDLRSVYLLGIVVLFLLGYGIVGTEIGMLIWGGMVLAAAVLYVLTSGTGQWDTMRELKIINATELYWFLVEYYSEIEHRRDQRRRNIESQIHSAPVSNPVDGDTLRV